jgi:hypothetical protein
LCPINEYAIVYMAVEESKSSTWNWANTVHVCVLVSKFIGTQLLRTYWRDRIAPVLNSNKTLHHISF